MDAFSYFLRCKSREKGANKVYSFSKRCIYSLKQVYLFDELIHFSAEFPKKRAPCCWQWL